MRGGGSGRRIHALVRPQSIGALIVSGNRSRGSHARLARPPSTSAFALATAATCATGPTASSVPPHAPAPWLTFAFASPVPGSILTSWVLLHDTLRLPRDAPAIESMCSVGVHRLRSNASRMSRARRWHERCGEASAARVTLPGATAPATLLQRHHRSPGRRSGRRLHTLARQRASLAAP